MAIKSWVGGILVVHRILQSLNRWKKFFKWKLFPSSIFFVPGWSSRSVDALVYCDTTPSSILQTSLPVVFIVVMHPHLRRCWSRNASVLVRIHWWIVGQHTANWKNLKVLFIFNRGLCKHSHALMLHIIFYRLRLHAFHGQSFRTLQKPFDWNSYQYDWGEVLIFMCRNWVWSILWLFQVVLR